MTIKPDLDAPNPERIASAPVLTELSALAQSEFTARLADIFEHSPWVAEHAWDKRPFADLDALHAAMVAAMWAAPETAQLALIRAHPELAGKEAAAGALTAASTGEQRGAGLDQCTAEELARLRTLNAAYRERFGFPFIIAVKRLTRDQIMEALVQRLQNDGHTEFKACLTQIARIARFRLDAMFS